MSAMAKGASVVQRNANAKVEGKQHGCTSVPPQCVSEWAAPGMLPMSSWFHITKGEAIDFYSVGVCDETATQ